MDKEFIKNPVEAYEKLKQENEELKDEIYNIKEYKKLYKLSGKCFFDSARRCYYFDDFVKTRQALEEIRDLKVSQGIL